MSVSVTAGGHSQVATAGALPGLRGARAASGRASIGAMSDRLCRMLGRMMLGLPPSTWLLVDVSILAGSVLAAYRFFPPPAELAAPHVPLWQALSVFSLAVILASLVFGLYERETFLSRSRTLTRMVLTTVTATIVAYAVIYVVMYATVGRRMSTLAMSLFFLGGVGVRLAAWWAVQKVHCGLLVVGSSALFESFQAAQAQGLLHEYKLLGYASSGPPPSRADGAGPVEREGWSDGDRVSDIAGDDPHLGSIFGGIASLGRMGVTDIVVADAAARDPGVMRWMVPSLQRGIRVTSEAVFYEKATGQILVDQITPSWFLLADLKVHCDQRATLKRSADLVIAGLGLLLSAALWPLIALAVKLSDGGPVFYSQDRVGQNGRVFRLYKFRTMRLDAENGRSVWCAPNDARVTRVGRVLRRTRLDELPQLYNVLAGQMSIVGPRPERPDIVRELCRKVPFYAERHLVKPGITGWAQISFRYGASVEDAARKLQFDLYYLKHMSLELDMIS
ncbi:MAG: exopolysaccharide biosynthesis polyprenyl glycosylphosphotransferase, partial [Phycisphaerae bacterium]